MATSGQPGASNARGCGAEQATRERPEAACVGQPADANTRCLGSLQIPLQGLLAEGPRQEADRLGGPEGAAMQTGGQGAAERAPIRGDGAEGSHGPAGTNSLPPLWGWVCRQ